jgi:hypothetical protein
MKQPFRRLRAYPNEPGAVALEAAVFDWASRLRLRERWRPRAVGGVSVVVAPWELVLTDTTAAAVRHELPELTRDDAGVEVAFLRIAGANDITTAAGIVTDQTLVWDGVGGWWRVP